jgi:hypothetical protein
MKEISTTTMKAIIAVLLAISSSLPGVLRAADAVPASAPAANPAPPPSAAAKVSAAELEKLAMPIALHPDPLIAVILPASVYPLEIVQAARLVKDTNNIPKLDDQPWDENVKEVARYPDLIAKMDADLAWTTALGQAFLDQRQELLETIQSLRGKAQTAGTLQTTAQQIVVVTNMVVEKVVEQQTVVVTNTIVQIQPSNPEVVYVPSYPPTAYYPPPGYVYNPYAPLVTFGLGMAAGAIIANNWNHCDWHGGDVNVDVDRNVNRNSNRNVNRADARSGSTARTSQQKWQPDQNRMRSSGSPSAQNREARGWSGSGGTGGARPSQVGSAGTVGARPSQQPAYGGSQRPSAGTQPARSPGAGQGASVSQRPASSGGAARPSTTGSPSVSRGGGQSSSAFSGVGSGSSARSSSSRGASSMGGGGRSGGGRTGGRSGGGRR